MFDRCTNSQARRTDDFNRFGLDDRDSSMIAILMVSAVLV
jgi:hypothetical protein